MVASNFSSSSCRLVASIDIGLVLLESELCKFAKSIVITCQTGLSTNLSDAALAPLFALYFHFLTRRS
jgi:hypothetical protein